MIFFFFFFFKCLDCSPLESLSIRSSVFLQIIPESPGFIYLFIYGCVGSSPLREGFL